MCVAGKDAGCYVDSFSGVDSLIDDPQLANNSSLWWDFQRAISTCKSNTCVNGYKAKQNTLEKANDVIRNNVCYYTDCSAGEASFILKNNKAIGVRLQVEIIETEPKRSYWDKFLV
jgi:hypothetical protein